MSDGILFVNRLHYKLNFATKILLFHQDFLILLNYQNKAVLSYSQVNVKQNQLQQKLVNVPVEWITCLVPKVFLLKPQIGVNPGQWVYVRLSFRPGQYTDSRENNNEHYALFNLVRLFLLMF